MIRPTIQILQSVYPDQSESNPYVSLLWQNTSESVNLQPFSWRRALTGPVDALHIHWPEELLRQPGCVRRALTPILFSMMLVRLKLQKIPVVRTRHNVEPHEAGNPLERFLLRRLDRQTVVWVEINPVVSEYQDTTHVQILHGHYRDWFRNLRVPRAAERLGVVSYFGFIREYKNVPSLIREFNKINNGDLELRILGKPSSTDLASEIERARAGNDRVHTELTYVDDARLVEELAQTGLVVLPYSEMFNSGAALLSLSLDVPILVPNTPANQALSDEVGPGWVFMYDGELSSIDILNTLTNLRDFPTVVSQPDLSRRDWEQAGDAHEAVYRQAIALTRGKQDA
ncbi:hypothetical protein [Mycetocola tolaasinivorans]|uniref:hypothetical protein n=1 Tax=Mycetocola tolaasinivorans TaxID=76635 RepID=UPI0011C36954|nr:hypothetical protein [Mycetocola tolaasinivorans]